MRSYAYRQLILWPFKKRLLNWSQFIHSTSSHSPPLSPSLLLLLLSLSLSRDSKVAKREVEESLKQQITQQQSETQQLTTHIVKPSIHEHFNAREN